MLERRREVRVPQNKLGTIKYGPAGYELSCTVIDLTSRGAGIVLARTFGVPTVFQLAVNGEAATRHCRVIWAEGKKLGVAFE